MLFSNVKYFGNDFKFHIGDVLVENGEIISVSQTDGDGKGGYLLPGLIDIHFHGNSGADFSDGDYEGLKTIAKYHAQHGVTSFSPASMTLPEEVLAQIDTHLYPAFPFRMETGDVRVAEMAVPHGYS